MFTPLLKTKLYIPPLRRELVSRPRLIERLKAGVNGKLTLISAPAGFGKTTLLSEWVTDCGRPVAWVSLDERDNDLVRFLAYLVAALRTVGAKIGPDALSAFGTPTVADATMPSATEPLLTVLVNEIAAIPDPFVLVLDDYHAIKAPPIHNALAFLLDHQPTQMHLVISTRSDPPLPTTRLRGRGQVTELRLTDLRFAADEVTAFLNRVMGLNLTADEVTALAARTEGWIAGLQMAAVSLQRRQDTARFIPAFTGSNRYVLDYLVEEVLQRQPDGVQAFLLQTSILDRLTGPLCDAVLGEEDAVAPGREVLEYLERANLFLVPLDSHREWYRYHGLFADLLRQRLQHTQPDRVAALHRRASEWYERNGLLAAAIDHALPAKDYERAAHLVDEYAGTVWQQGDITTLSNWLEALPDELVGSKPQLCIFHAWALFANGQHQAAEKRLEVAERVLDSTTGGVAEASMGTPGQRRDLDVAEQKGRAAAIRAFIASFRGDISAIIRFSRQALEYLPRENAAWRGAVVIALGTAHTLSGDLTAAYQAYAEAVTASRAAGNIYLDLNASMRLALNQWQQGRLQRASEICQQQLDFIDERGLSQTAMAGVFFALWGEILCQWNHLDEAWHSVKKGLELCRRGGSAGALGFCYLALMRVLLARQDAVAAMEAIRELEKLARESDMPVWITAGIVAGKARIWMAQGELAAVAQLLDERGLNVDGDLNYLRQGEYLSLARLLAAQGRLEEATKLLGRLRQAAETAGRMGWVPVILVQQAVVFQAQGDGAQAMTCLERALSLAEPEGCVRVFVDEGPAVKELLRRVASRGIAPQYVARLLVAFGDATTGKGQKMDRPAPSSVLGPPSLVDPLTARELEVLRFLTTHLSSTEIAEQLFISVNTVRSHMRSIYGKLNVHSRYQAIGRAKELNLL